MVKQEVVFVCPRGRRNRRIVTGRGTVNIRCGCGCGCGYTYSVRFR